DGSLGTVYWKRFRPGPSGGLFRRAHFYHFWAPIAGTLCAAASCLGMGRRLELSVPTLFGLLPFCVGPLPVGFERGSGLGPDRKICRPACLGTADRRTRRANLRADRGSH